MSPHRRRISAFLLVVFVFGCTSWHVEGVTPQAFFANQPPARVRVTLVSGEKLEIHQPRLVGDSVLGTPRPGGFPVQVALADIREVETSGTSTAKSAGLGLGIVAVIGVVAAVVALAAWGGPFGGVSCSGN